MISQVRTHEQHQFDHADRAGPFGGRRYRRFGVGIAICDAGVRLLWLYRRRKSGVGFGPLQMKILAFLRLANPLRLNAADRSVIASIL